MKQKWSQIENKQRFSIKKLSVGVASVSIGFLSRVFRWFKQILVEKD